MTAREALRRLVVDRPDLDQSELASIIGVSRQRVHQLTKDPVDPIPVTARRNHHSMVSQQRMVRLVEGIQSIMRSSDGDTVATWRDLRRLGHFSQDFSVILRDREPLFHGVIDARLKANRRALRSTPTTTDQTHDHTEPHPTADPSAVHG